MKTTFPIVQKVGLNAFRLWCEDAAAAGGRFYIRNEHIKQEGWERVTARRWAGCVDGYTAHPETWHAYGFLFVPADSVTPFTERQLKGGPDHA